VVSSCHKEVMNEVNANKDNNNITLDAKKVETEVTVSETTTSTTVDDGTHCVTTRLMAGQHYEAGIITVDVVGNQLAIIYTTNNDWAINATHLSIVDCQTESFPITNSGNPKVGNFEYSSTHSDGTHEVTYYIDLSEVPENYCFAAHAEVTGPTGGQTAWGEGTGFDGNSWAMFVEGILSDCTGGDNPGDDSTGDDSTVS
tara:strand:- start:2228 stop:2827 length:600 start_codon:yes stop_codon:yes gene_type:complete